MAKDFDAPAAGGRRLRIPLTVYDADTRNFRAVRESAALVTVANEREQRRLWKAIEQTIAEWKNDRDAGGPDRPAAAASHV